MGQDFPRVYSLFLSLCEFSDVSRHQIHDGNSQFCKVNDNEAKNS
jgi:hypothetical protein